MDEKKKRLRSLCAEAKKVEELWDDQGAAFYWRSRQKSIFSRAAAADRLLAKRWVASPSDRRSRRGPGQCAERPAGRGERRRRRGEIVVWPLSREGQ